MTRAFASVWSLVADLIRAQAPERYAALKHGRIRAPAWAALRMLPNRTTRDFADANVPIRGGRFVHAGRSSTTARSGPYTAKKREYG